VPADAGNLLRRLVETVVDNRRLHDEVADLSRFAALGRTLAGVLHELKNPLSNILGALDRVRSLMPPDEKLARWNGIVDERAWWQRESGQRHPVTLDDYSRVASARTGRRARQLAAQGADVLVRIDDQEHPLAPGSGVVLESITIGMGSVAAGPQVRVVDVLGLADALGSRIAADPAARIGHQKRLPPALLLARLALAGEDDQSLPSDVDPASLEAARRLLRRPAVARLLAATRDPLTPTRALRNIRQALALTRLRLPMDRVPGTPRTDLDKTVRVAIERIP